MYGFFSQVWIQEFSWYDPICYLTHSQQAIPEKARLTVAICLFSGAKGNQFRLALVQYVFEGVEREVKVKPHGNGKGNKPYYRTSETTKQRLQQLADSNSPKEVFHQSLEESGGILHLKSAGGHARDLKQVKNIKQKNQRNEVTI